MDNKRIRIYVASSVGIDYFFFLCKTLRDAGFDVRELYLIPEQTYRTQARSNRFVRIWLRINMYFLYPIYLAWCGLTSASFSIFIVSSNTFYAPILTRSLLRYKRVCVIHMLYDLYPDALEVAGNIKSTSVISRLVGWVMRKSQRECDGTVYLGRFLRKHAENRWGRAKQGAIMDISTDLLLYNSSFVKLPIANQLVIHYGGQLGHLHDADSIIASVRAVFESGLGRHVRFNFCVSGAQAKRLRAALHDLPVEICSTMPSSQWRHEIQRCHIGLVSLSPQGASVCLPSKSYAMMAGGMAIIAITPLWSDLGTMIHSLEAGWVINNAGTEEEPASNSANYYNQLGLGRNLKEISSDFVSCLEKLLNEPDLLDQARQNAFYGVREHFGQEKLQKKWQSFLSSVVDPIQPSLLASKPRKE